MTFRTIFSAFVLSLQLSVAQTTAPAPNPAGAGDEAKTPAVREAPPDQKAYQDAAKLTDPSKKIDALEKFKQDFPTSVYAQSANSEILRTLLKSMRDQPARIHKTTDAMYRAAAAKDKDASRGATIVTTRNRQSEAASIAEQFLTSGAFLKDAETWARRSIELMRQNVWISEQREVMAKRKQAIPSQEDLAKRFNELRASRVGTLGRIEAKLGKEALARKLLEESYAVSSGNVAVAGALGELAMKAGEEAKAMDYLIAVRLSGRAPATSNAVFEDLYKKSHNGTLEGLEAMLDIEYRKRFPNPVHVETYRASEKRSDRMVLGEVFTGSGCAPCAAADLAFDAAMERFTRKDLAVVMYHQHIPRPDPMTTPETTARAKYYNVRGVPTFAVDGKDSIGGGSRDMAQGVYERLAKDLEKELEVPAEGRIKLNAAVSGKGVKATAQVDGVQSETKDVRVQVLLVEKQLRYNGENGVRFHPMVVRAFGGEKGEGYKLDGDSGSFQASWDLDAVSQAIKDHLDDYEAKGHRGESFKFTAKKYAIDPNNLAVVVFVQDNKSKHVLQAAWADLSTPGDHTSTDSNGNQVQ